MMAQATGGRPLVVVAGATSVIGPYLLRRLVDRGYPVHALSRKPRPGWAGPTVAWTQGEAARGLPALPSGSAMVHLPPLWLAPALVAAAPPGTLAHVVAFGSTSRFTRAGSTSSADRALVARLAEAESALAAACASAAAAWTILRPTLAYGGGADGNISVIAGFIRRFGFFPVAGRARGRRQPVHADDLAAAAVAALEHPAARNRAYDLAGGETLEYTEMVRRVFGGLGRRTRILHVPRTVYRAALTAARVWPRWRHLAPAMADRMDQDLCVDHAEARRDLGYAPRAFSYIDDDRGRAALPTPGPGC